MNQFKEICRKDILEQYKEIGNDEVSLDDVYVVWFVKSLGTAKALLSNKIKDGRYWEYTYNSDKDVIYVDRYVKEDNKDIHVTGKLFV